MLSMGLLSIHAFATDQNNQENIKVSNSAEDYSNVQELSDDSAELPNTTDSEFQNVLHFAKIGTDSILVTPESLQPTNVTLPASDRTYSVEQSKNENYYAVQIGGYTYWIQSENLMGSNDQPEVLTKKRNKFSL